MVKKRGKKTMTSKAKLFQYPEENMAKALKAVREEGMAVATASKKYNVPRTSVRNRLSGRTSDKCRKVGPNSILGSKVEDKLVNWVVDLSSRGFPINREGLFYSVNKLIQEANIKTPFLNNTPGRKWFEAFLNRHPQVSQKHAEFINKARAAVSEKTIRKWFEETRVLLSDNIEILNHPSRIFNMDETALFLSLKGALVLGEKGKSIYDIVSSSEKENVTTLIMVNAEGLIAPPLTIFKFQRLPKVYAEAAPRNWGVGISESGWMQSKQLYEYFANVFLPFLEKAEIPRPIIVFLDGHSSHLSLNLSIFCKSNGIILVCLPPNTTHILQPLDVAFFYPLKKAWKDLSRKWRYDHDGVSIQKKDIPQALNEILENKNFTSAIISGFRCCGLYPFDENAPNYKKCVVDYKPKSDHVLKDEIDENDGVGVIDSHLLFIESMIDDTILQEFNNSYNNQPNIWLGEEKYLELYKLWTIIKNKIQPPSECTVGNTNSDQLELTCYEPVAEDLIIFDFSDLADEDYNGTINIEEEELQVCQRKKITVLEDILIVPGSTSTGNNADDLLFSTPEISGRPEISEKCDSVSSAKQEEVQENYEIYKDGNNEKEIEDEIDKFSCEKEKCVKTPNVESEALKMVSNKFEENSEVEKTKTTTVLFEITSKENSNDNEELSEKPEAKKVKSSQLLMKKRSVSEVLEDIVTWPSVAATKPTNSNEVKKRKGNHLPSVITSEKWLEIMEAKENVKAEIERKRSIKAEKKKLQSKKAEVNKKDAKEKVPSKIISQEPVDDEPFTLTPIVKGSYVIVRYENCFYPAKVLNVEQDDYYCCAMSRSGLKYWKWPEKADVVWYSKKDIVQKIEEPSAINTRGVCVVPEIEHLVCN